VAPATDLVGILKKFVSLREIVFVAFAIEDERQRDFLKGQSLHPRAPYEFIDMSVKEPYDSGWKEKVRTRIRRSHGVIVLVSKNSLTSDGQAWEIQCAKDENGRSDRAGRLAEADHIVPAAHLAARARPQLRTRPLR